ncbi:MAG: TraR/DksA C4-type zinc finger protein [Phycisphaeraceae bacterium]|nr:TraR/DksA C4-type zinc finger protein [Phycisphaerae bacterium]MBX3391315.1 TraR/DksA C4-type zinc finger protein [Phycisphaeraceae bacterium]
MAKKTSKSSKTTAGKPGSSAGGTRSPVKNKPAGKSRPAPSKGKAKVAPVKKPRPAERPKAKPAPKGSPTKAGAPSKAAPAPADGKGGRKGITIVTPKVVKKPKPKPRAPMSGAAAVSSMMGGKSGTMKPLIPSGPAATPFQPLGYHGHDADGPRKEAKSPFGKKELAHFRQVLLQKRVELVRDVSSMESEALKRESGSLSSLPQHMAEQGSETYDQSLSLDLAAADRKLIREIDEALTRIENGTYGVCELTGKPIKIERLEELPWAKYSIEAARDLERRQMRL